MEPISPTEYLFTTEVLMSRRWFTKSSQRGYTLIELLVVLVIVGVLGIVGIVYLTPRSTKAVKSGLLEVATSFKQARSLAIASGKDLNFVITNNPARLQVYDLQSDGSLNSTALMDVTFNSTWQRNATFFTSSPPPFGAEKEPVKGLSAVANLNFSGWDSPILVGTSQQGFSPGGTPQILSGVTRSPALTGIWLGIYGTTRSGDGVPYGVILITGRGTITTFYKSDSLKTGSTTPEAAWQRLD